MTIECLSNKRLIVPEIDGSMQLDPNVGGIYKKILYATMSGSGLSQDTLQYGQTLGSPSLGSQSIK